jgi:hypothetical protein
MCNEHKNGYCCSITAAALTGIFSTTIMVAYADESEIETEQKLKQENVGSGESINQHCHQSAGLGLPNLEIIQML